MDDRIATRRIQLQGQVENPSLFLTKREEKINGKYSRFDKFLKFLIK